MRLITDHTRRRCCCWSIDSCRCWVSDADIVSWRSRGDSSQIVLVQVKGTSCFAEVALDVFEKCFHLHGAQWWSIDQLNFPISISIPGS